MSLSVLLSFALTSLILAAAPGPDNIFVLTQSALYGVRKGILVIAQDRRCLLFRLLSLYGH